MDAHRAARNAAWHSHEAPVVASLLGASATTLFALVAVAPIVICARRAGGALVEPLAAMPLVAVAGALALSAIVFRRVGAAAVAPSHAIAKYAVWATPSIVLALWALGLLFPETSPVGAVGFLGLVLAEEGWSWGRFGRLAHAWAAPGVARSDRAGATARESPLSDVAAIDESLESVEEGVTQRMVRRRQQDGRETIEGWTRVEFQGSQRHATAHLAICPPFEFTPECYAEQADGPPADIKVAQVLPYGVRLEVKLDAPAPEPCAVAIEFSIVANSS
jgi:hypothetical protein